MIYHTETYDVIVCGGGLAGFCAAIASARRGAKTCLVHDRPVLGGNASSEVRVTVHGAAQFHSYARETGILSEILIEERARNHEDINENGWTNSVFDQVLYDIARREPNLTLHLNTAIHDVLLGEDDLSALSQIPCRPLPDTDHSWYHRPACASHHFLVAVVGRVANAEVELTLRAPLFIDCTGDGFVADLAGCEWRMGSESHEQTGESHAPREASKDTMGNSIHIRARDIGRAAPFTAPEWAKRIPDADFLYARGRAPHDIRGGYWWIEIGIPWNTIHDNEIIRHELTAWALGVWDWIKNRDENTRERATTFALDWIGQVPGKRESRRIMGEYLLSEHDIQANTKHPDEIAFGGWFVDLHTPGGLLSPHAEPASAEGYKPDSEYAVKSYVGPYGIPLRSCIAKDVDNLFLAGRCVSATHAALGTVRVMGTTALVGQAVGTAAALVFKKNLPSSSVLEHIGELQQHLLRDGCFLPNIVNADQSDLARNAKATASSEAMSLGIGADDPWAAGGLGRCPSKRASSLEKAAAQWIAVSGGRIDRVAACLENHSEKVKTIKARLVRPEHIWDYRRQLPVLAEAELMVSPGNNQWVEWTVNLTDVPDGFVRLELLSDDAAVGWRYAQGVLPGQVGGWGMSAAQFRRTEEASTFAFRVEPGQPAYGPKQVISGVTRPHRTTNLWRSDPGQPLPQWLQLTWAGEQAISNIELIFPGHLLREYHATPPFFRDPQTPRDYNIEMWKDGEWIGVTSVKDNYHRHRRHALERPVSTCRLRVVILATNGDPSAAVYEMRCYS